VVLTRNCLVVTLSTLLEHHPSTRALLLTALCLGLAADHLAARPYSLPAANRLDTAAWTALALLAALDLYASAVYAAGRRLTTWSAVDWLARVVTSLPVVVGVIAAVVLIGRALLRRAARTRPL